MLKTNGSLASTETNSNPRYPLTAPLMIGAAIPLDGLKSVFTLLKAYDQEHGTRHFQRLCYRDVAMCNGQVEEILTELSVANLFAGDILDWFHARSAQITPSILV